MKPDPRMTTNIKIIMKDNRPETAAQYLSHNSKRKLSITKSNPKIGKGALSMPKIIDSSVEKSRNV